MGHELLSALAELLWPLLAFLAALWLRRPIKALVDRLSERGGALEIGGFKVTLSEATVQQQVQITDLQAQVAKLHELVAGSGASARAPAVRDGAIEGAESVAQRAARRILWVDDHPENNATLQGSLEQLGFEITNATSTEQGLLLFESAAFDAVVSDMGRGRHRDAGIDLVRRIRMSGSDVPYFVYASASAVRNYGSAAATAGADGVTASPTQLLLMLQGKRDEGARDA